MRTHTFFFLLALATLFLIPETASAQNNVNQIDQIPESFEIAIKGISQKLADIARNLLMSFLIIELIWSLGKIVMEGDDFGAIMGAFFKRILIAGFFLALVDGVPTPSGNVGFGSFIIQSAEALTEQSTGQTSLKPSDVFFQMFNAGLNVFDTSTGVVGKIFGAIVWLIIIIMGAVIVGLMILTYIEIYVIFTVGILALGFGAWSTTQQFATNYLFAAVGKIFKLFVMILVATLISVQLNAFGPLEGVEDGIIAIGVSLIFVMIMSTVPGAVEQMISGIPSASSDGAVAGNITSPAKGAASKAGGAAGRAAAKVSKAGLQTGWDKLGGPAAKTKLGGALAETIRGLKGKGK